MTADEMYSRVRDALGIKKGYTPFIHQIASIAKLHAQSKAARPAGMTIFERLGDDRYYYMRVNEELQIKCIEIGIKYAKRYPNNDYEAMMEVFEEIAAALTAAASVTGSRAYFSMIEDCFCRIWDENIIEFAWEDLPDVEALAGQLDAAELYAEWKARRSQMEGEAV